MLCLLDDLIKFGVKTDVKDGTQYMASKVKFGKLPGLAIPNCGRG